MFRQTSLSTGMMNLKASGNALSGTWSAIKAGGVQEYCLSGTRLVQ